MNFEFATANRIIFGPGSLNALGDHAKKLGSTILLATSFPDTSPTFQKTINLLNEVNCQTTIFPVVAEPTIGSILAGIDLARKSGCNLVVALGGGSTIDNGKAIAILITNPGEIVDYLEVIGPGKKLEKPPIPFIAIPTTSGTGAEVTRNAVISSENQKIKISLRSPLMLPRLALVDPDLTHSMPAEITASTGMDALTQLIESFLSISANPLTDSLCKEGIIRVVRSLRRAYIDPLDAPSREDMSIASLFGGLALANSRLGAVHGFASSIGGFNKIPHGTICARLLPIVMKSNLLALKIRDQSNPVLQRFEVVSQLLTSDNNAGAMDGVDWLYQLREDLKIPLLRDFGISADDFTFLVEGARQASSMKGNPISLSEYELRSIIEEAI